jgi:cytochrome P450
MKTAFLLFLSTGEKWARRRKLITPSFHFEILNDFLLVINTQVDVFISRLDAQVKTSAEKFDICPYICSLALDIICGTGFDLKYRKLEYLKYAKKKSFFQETTMGKNLHIQQDQNSKYVNAVVG